MTRSPISVCVIEHPAPIVQSRPIDASGPITAVAAIMLPDPISGPRPDHSFWINRYSAPAARSCMDR